jgi:hypothetical protein
MFFPMKIVFRKYTIWVLNQLNVVSSKDEIQLIKKKKSQMSFLQKATCTNFYLSIYYVYKNANCLLFKNRISIKF